MHPAVHGLAHYDASSCLSRHCSKLAHHDPPQKLSKAGLYLSQSRGTSTMIVQNCKECLHIRTNRPGEEISSSLECASRQAQQQQNDCLEQVTCSTPRGPVWAAAAPCCRAKACDWTGPVTHCPGPWCPRRSPHAATQRLSGRIRQVAAAAAHRRRHGHVRHREWRRGRLPRFCRSHRQAGLRH